MNNSKEEFTVKLLKEERDAIMDALSRHILRLLSGDVPEGDVPLKFFKSALDKI